MPNRRNPPGQPLQQHDPHPQQHHPQQHHPQQHHPQQHHPQQHQQPQQAQPVSQQPPQGQPNQKGSVPPLQKQNTGPQPTHPPPSPALISHPRPPHPNEHPTLGLWEPSITNVVPPEDLTRKITDFLLLHVVMNDDPSLDWTGSGGPMLEIEAKLGQIVSRGTESRLRLPILTEAILIDGRDFAFRSTMTEQQHKTFNNFLNERYAESSPPSRVKMDYIHTKERDTFYELPPHTFHTLPLLVQKFISKKTPKVRVTTNMKTGQVINKIIKCRVADLNIYSPATAFDWRVSVNLEMPYTGEVDEKSGGTGGGKGDARGTGGERNKDRMSYRCLDGKFTIDLTQVTQSDSSKKEHELEVEMSSATLKRQGTLAMARKENGFEELVRGFVNNVRTLVRVVDYVPYQ
ncbi:CYTH-like domain-containing protein [Kalaharituber pfeilii]|nr:CYTH-like domain-containing protein [Kalaharituber pfeilii]